MATDVARLSLDISVNGAKRAQSAMESIRSGSVRLTRATDQQIAAQNRLNSTFTRQSGPAVGRFRRSLSGLRQSFKLQKGATQQAGFQIQDFTTQIAAGQSATVAFGQQASQLAGILGPGGAVLGAFIAIGAALTGVVISAFSETEESTESLRKRILDLRDSVDELTDAQIRQVKVEFFAENRDRLKQINEFRSRISDLRSELEAFANAGADGTQVTAGLTDPDEARKEINRLTAEIDTLFQTGNQAAEELDELINGTDEAGQAAKDAADKVREMVEAAEQQAATIGMSARAVATYEAALAGANAEQILAIDQAYQRIEAYEAEAESAKNAAKEQARAEARRRAIARGTTVSTADDPLLQRVEAEKRANDIIVEDRRRAEQEMLDATRQANAMRKNSFLESAQVIGESFGGLSNAQQSSIMAIGGAFDNLQSIMQAGGEKSFQAYKRLAQTEAAIAGSLAVVKALGSAPPPFNIALATTIGALTAVEIAAIDQQEYQGSYLGGGYTGTGSRTGGVDGSGGFPAILHPNETVIDHERAGAPSNASNVNQTIVMNVSGDVTAQTRQEILKSIPMIRQQARQSVLQASQEGGAMSRAMGRR